MKSKKIVFKNGLELIVHDKDQRSSHTSKNVGSSSLEESLSSFLFSDFLETVKGSVVKDFLLSVGSLSARLHHESSSDGVKRVGHKSSHGGDIHGVNELNNNTGVLLVLEKDGFSRVITSEVHSSVSNDTHHGNSESLVKTEKSVGFIDLGETVNESVELSLSVTLTDIGGKSGSGEIEGVHETEGSGTSSSS
jgi:hypothetical protein